MDFDREWTVFALAAETDTFGHARTCAAHNELRRLNRERLAAMQRFNWTSSKPSSPGLYLRWDKEIPFPIAIRVVEVGAGVLDVEEAWEAEGEWSRRGRLCHRYGAVYMALPPRRDHE